MTSEHVRADGYRNRWQSAFALPAAAYVACAPLPCNHSDASPFWPRAIVEVRAPRLQPVLALTVSEMIGSLRDAGLPISAIAEATRVERKTVYSWLDGGDARPNHVSRVAQVHGALPSASNRNLGDLYRMWSTPLASGVTLKSLLAAETLDMPTIRRAVDALYPKAEAAAARRRGMVAPDGANGFAEGLEVGISA